MLCRDCQDCRHGIIATIKAESRHLKAAIRPNDPIHLNKTVMLRQIVGAITPNDPIQLNSFVESS